MCLIFIVCSFGSRNTLQCYKRGCFSQEHSDLQYLSWELYLCLLPFLLSSCFGLWSQHSLWAYGFWTPAEFMWSKGLWRNEGKQALILARTFCAVCFFVSCFHICYLLFPTCFPGAGHGFCSWCMKPASSDQGMWISMVVALFKATLLQTVSGFLCMVFL